MVAVVDFPPALGCCQASLFAEGAVCRRDISNRDTTDIRCKRGVIIARIIRRDVMGWRLSSVTYARALDGRFILELLEISGDLPGLGVSL